jgi:hypothetical protein
MGSSYFQIIWAMAGVKSYWKHLKTSNTREINKSWLK